MLSKASDSEGNNGGGSKVSRWEHLCLICRREENTRKINGSQGWWSPDTTRTEGIPCRKAWSDSLLLKIIIFFYLMIILRGFCMWGNVRAKELEFYLL